MQNIFDIAALIWVGLISRVFFHILAILGNYAVIDHAAEGVTVYEFNRNVSSSYVVDTYTKWDSSYYISISKFGYSKEQYLAFFPMYPWSIDMLTLVLRTWATYVSDDLLRVICGLFISNFCLLLSIGVLYALLSCVESNRRKVSLAVLLFIFNPATVFFSGVYTESMFSLISWTAMLMIAYNKMLAAAVFVVCSCCIRSNGSLLVIFAGIFFISQISLEDLRNVRYKHCLRSILSLLLICLSAVLPALLWDYIIKHVVCLHLYETSISDLSATNNDLLMCSCSKEIISSASVYSYVQEKYWNVGFLNYFRWKQLPNFLLAVPVHLISFATLWTPCIDVDTESDSESESNGCEASPALASASRNCEHWTQLLFVFDRKHCKHVRIAMKGHLFVVLMVGLFFAHVQISTRLLLSSCPLLYLTMADIVSSTESHSPRSILCRHMFLLYVFVYVFGGTILHVNFYPWT